MFEKIQHAVFWQFRWVQETVIKHVPLRAYQAHIRIGMDDIRRIQSFQKCPNLLLLTVDEAGVGDRLTSGWVDVVAVTAGIEM